MKRKDLIVFEIEEHSLRVLRAKILPDQSLQVLGLDAVLIQQFSPELLTKAISSVVTSKDKKSQVVVVLARSQVIFKNFSLPSQSKEELQKMVSLQMAAQVPYAREDIVFDYSLLGQDAAGFTKILSAVVHKDVVDELFKVFRAAGFAIHQFVLSSSSVVRWFYARRSAEMAAVSGTIGILNIESLRSELAFARAGQLVYAREIKYGRRDIGADMEKLFFKDISLTLETYVREHDGDPVAHLYVLAPLSIHERLRETLKTSKAIEIEFIDSFDVSVQNKGLAIGEIFQREDLSPVVCLGAAEEGLKPSLNLLPVEVQKRQRAAAEKGQYLRTAFLIALNLVLFFLIFFQAFYRDQLYLNDLNTRSLAMRSRVEGVKLKIQQLSEIERYVNPKVSTVDMIYSLYDMTPKEISFQLLSLDREGNLTIQGISEARTSVNDFHRNLTNSPLFKDASLQYAAQRRFFEGEITDFKITAVINQPKEP